MQEKLTQSTDNTGNLQTSRTNTISFFMYNACIYENVFRKQICCEKKILFSLFLFAFFVSILLLITLFSILSYSHSRKAELKKANDIAKEEKDEEEYNIVKKRREIEKEQVLEKIQEEIPQTPQKDVEVLEGYKKEVDQYIDAFLFFINFMDTTFRLAFNDLENRDIFLLIADDKVDRCIKYLGDKSILPKEILETVEGSERLAVNYCKSSKKHSSLIKGYWDETDFDKMSFLLKELREHRDNLEIQGYVLKRICKDLEGMIFLKKRLKFIIISSYFSTFFNLLLA